MTPSAIVGIIPARLASSRFPEKVLADRTGKPLIQHVREAARAARSLTRLVVAADDPRVMSAVAAFGGEGVLTRADHPNGTCRLAEAASLLGLDADSLVVNIQGDEPEIEPHAIDAAVHALLASRAPMATVASPFAPGEDPDNPNIVKAVVGADGHALYFSRARLPFARQGGTPQPPLKHVGLYAYRRPFLGEYARMIPTPLERCEMLEQLRVLEHGHRIAVATVAVRSHGIDTPEQYDAFVGRYLSR
ncbi:MAG: 3-deoxy-manno-octulosonate cytidylyltransferase [Phycisphaerae bacterium]|nr:3-deoxy-manno-octulosonate cytidylyltransferase [Phycisphaerae bacterium]